MWPYFQAGVFCSVKFINALKPTDFKKKPGRKFMYFPHISSANLDGLLIALSTAKLNKSTLIILRSLNYIYIYIYYSQLPII